MPAPSRATTSRPSRRAERRHRALSATGVVESNKAAASIVRNWGVPFASKDLSGVDRGGDLTTHLDGALVTREVDLVALRPWGAAPATLAVDANATSATFGELGGRLRASYSAVRLRLDSPGDRRRERAHGHGNVERRARVGRAPSRGARQAHEQAGEEDLHGPRPSSSRRNSPRAIRRPDLRRRSHGGQLRVVRLFACRGSALIGDEYERRA